MIAYQFLDAAGMADVARERVAELEREHYRLRLLLGECAGNADAQAVLLGQIEEIERRHGVHTIVPATESDQPDQAAAVELPAEPADGAAKTDLDEGPVDAAPELAEASRNGHAAD